MLYWPFWKQDYKQPIDRYGTVGTGWGAGTGTVQVRYGYGMATIHGDGRYNTWVRKPYPCTVPTVPMYRTRTVYLYRTCTRTRTQTRTNRPVPI